MDSNRQFEALFEHASIGIVVTDSKGKIVNFNRYAEGQFNYQKYELLGKTVDVLIPTEKQATHRHQRDNFYKHPGPRRMGEGRDLFAQKKDGTEFPVEVSLSNYYVNSEIFVIAFVVDITVRKRNEAIVIEQKNELERIATKVGKLNAELEQKVEYRTKMLKETLAELEKSKDELSESLEKEKELNEMKSRFVTTASHEFRTPLSTILSSSFLLEKYNGNGNDPSKREKHINRIKTAVADMKSILEDFLSLGKLEEGLIKKNLEQLKANDLFTEMETIIDDMESVCKKDQSINFTFSGSGNATVDRLLFKHVLTNLISNAIKFSPENSAIKVDCNLTSERLSVAVADTGIGISEEDQQHLFQRFFRAKNATNIQGTGLGLHIVSKYLELMDGRIEIQSKLDKGSIFTAVIPQYPNS